ncbi:hypothetical protein T261_0251 [Streptomyces lydicus]|nr:hypothetical protein T261_0251 [Streptomyces lydicus]
MLGDEVPCGPWLSKWAAMAASAAKSVPGSSRTTGTPRPYSSSSTRSAVTSPSDVTARTGEDPMSVVFVSVGAVAVIGVWGVAVCSRPGVGGAGQRPAPCRSIVTGRPAASR